MATEEQPDVPRVEVNVDEDGELVVDYISEQLASIPTRVIVVEELCNCGVISKKRMKKRIGQIMDEMELKSVEIQTLSSEGTEASG